MKKKNDCKTVDKVSTEGQVPGSAVSKVNRFAPRSLTCGALKVVFGSERFYYEVIEMRHFTPVIL